MTPFTLHTGKMEEVLLQLPPDSFHSCVTDPPYGLSFMGHKWDYSVPSPEQWRQVYRVLRPGAFLLAFGGPRTYHRMVCAIEDAGFEIRDQIFWVFASGFPKSHNLDGEFAGWGSALKPAHEPIVVARKPLAGTILQNMQQHGTGAINIDGCRVEGEPWVYGNQPKLNGERYQPGQITPKERHAENVKGGENGRWPANVIHDGSPEVRAQFPEALGQQATTGPEHGDRATVNCYGNYGSRPHSEPRKELDKSAARFFYCAKTSRTDRNEGCQDLEDMPIIWSSGDTNPGSFQSEGTKKSSPNNHPTVKPTELMRYLCRLVTIPGGHILDPFCGSGSTGKAAILEHMLFTGIEMDAHNVAIAEARIQFALRTRDNQIALDI